VEVVMRILVSESHIGESAEIIRAAEERDHVVLRCQPVDDEVAPCLGLAADAACPLEDVVDAVIDVHPASDGRLSPRELCLLCSIRHDVPIVVAGSSPIGDAATETTTAAAVMTAERLVCDNDGRLPAYAVAQRARRELLALGHERPHVWVSYVDHEGIFDVVVGLSMPISVVDEAALDATLIPLFAEAMHEHRFGDVIYEGGAHDTNSV
jgi:hypothetical protein